MIDSYGLYVQHDFETGDSAHRTGLAYAIKGLFKEDTTQLGRAIELKLEWVEPGIYVRHPVGRQSWHSDPQTLSRDQVSRLVLGFAVNGKKKHLRNWLRQMIKRKGFHQNNKHHETGAWKMPDIAAPGEVRNLIRGLDAWYLYPALLVLDSLFLPDLLLRSKWDGGSLIVPDIKYAVSKYPTPAAYLANALLKRTSVYEEIQANHSKEKNGCVELQVLFKRLEDL